MFRFTEAEGQTVQSGMKKAYYSQGTFTSSPSDYHFTEVPFSTYQRELPQDLLSVIFTQNSKY